MFKQIERRFLLFFFVNFFVKNLSRKNDRISMLFNCWFFDIFPSVNKISVHEICQNATEMCFFSKRYRMMQLRDKLGIKGPKANLLFGNMLDIMKSMKKVPKSITKF